MVAGGFLVAVSSSVSGSSAVLVVVSVVAMVAWFDQELGVEKGFNFVDHVIQLLVVVVEVCCG